MTRIADGIDQNSGARPPCKMKMEVRRKSQDFPKNSKEFQGILRNKGAKFHSN